MRKNYRVNKALLIYFLCFFSCMAFSQTASGFIWPIDSPRVITGNYGELRPNHFHAGIDFSTRGQVNLQVYSVAEGYVSRIRVSATGYGKSVYITHPNGKVSLYAHLNAFSLKIADVVKQEQLAKQNYEVEIFPKRGAIPVRNNEIIGLSGNTGGSTGPHLHFEIRTEKSETPLNPLTFFKINDREKPVIRKIGFYSLADTCSPAFIKAVRVEGNSLATGSNSLTLGHAIIGFAFAGFDRCVPNGNPNNIFSAKLYMDDRLIYSHTLNNIDFSENRYVNEFSESNGGVKFQKCFLPTLYPAQMYGSCFNKGRILLSDSNYHHLKFIAIDESGNEQKLSFYIRAGTFDYYRPSAVKSDVFVNCNKDFTLRRNKLQMYMPAKTLFYSTPLIVDNALETTGRLIILPSGINLRNTAVIGFKVPERLMKNKTKLVLKSGSSVYAPTLRNDSVFYAVKNFGTFQLGTDTGKPKIRTFLNDKQLKKVKNPASFSFVIEDNSSGIMSYNLFLNNKWVIGEYDAKSNLLTYYKDEGTPAGDLDFKLVVEDKVGNKAELKYVLRR